jgi:hypothetical protein
LTTLNFSVRSRSLKSGSAEVSEGMVWMRVEFSANGLQPDRYERETVSERSNKIRYLGVGGLSAVSPINPSGLVSNWCSGALIGKLSFDAASTDLK